MFHTAQLPTYPSKTSDIKTLHLPAMPVAQLITHYEVLESSSSPSSPMSSPSLSAIPTTPPRQRLSLNTACGPRPSPSYLIPRQARQSCTHTPNFTLRSPSTSSTCSSSSASPPPAFRGLTPYSRSLSRTSSSTFSSPRTPRAWRSYPSSLDLALEAERYAAVYESEGLGLLEPRPCPLSRSRPILGLGLMDGIFEIMEGY